MQTYIINLENKADEFAIHYLKKFNKNRSSSKNRKKLASFLFFNGFTNKKIYSIYKIVCETL